MQLEFEFMPAVIAECREMRRKTMLDDAIVTYHLHVRHAQVIGDEGVKIGQ